MKAILTAILACITVLLSTVAFAQGNYFLLCRGPLTYATGTGGNTTVVLFQEATTSSGNGGSSLTPGSCAWTDRPLRSNEPTKIYVHPETSQSVRAAFVAFASCAGEPKCVVEFLAHNANSSSDPRFEVDDGYIKIWHPFP